MIKRRIAAALAFVLMFLTVSCSVPVTVTVPEQEQKPEEKKLISEGSDTKCEVKYREYAGDHSNLFLAKGDKIAVISPSALPSREQVDATVNGLKDWGYEPVEGKHVCDETRSLDDILTDLEWALKDPEIKAIFCVRGGYGASEVADALPEGIIESSDKLIIGYSDITVYHSVWASCGVPSIHACMSGTFGDFPESCFEAENNILRGIIPAYTCESSSYCKEGEAEGILIGGNLSTFTSVIGTAYDCTKTDRPYILFIEEEGENFQHLHRYLTVLKHADVLDKAAGIVFGEWTDIPADMGDYDGRNRGGKYESISDMISRQFLIDLDIPVAFGFPAGHGDSNYPMLMGEMAKIEVGADSYTLTCGADMEETGVSPEAIKKRGVIRVGTAGDYQPMSYFDPNTETYVGFDAELAQDLANDLGVEIEYVKTSWPTLMEDTLAGKFDLAICGITITDVRKDEALMSEGYLGNGKTVLCRTEDADKYLSLDAINKPEVKVMENPGGLNEKFARENLPDATLIIHDVNQEIPGLIAEGEADVMITETMEAGYYVGLDERLAAPLIYEPFNHGELGILMPKENEELLKYVNVFLEKEKNSGRIDELADEYIYRYIDDKTELDNAA